MKMKKVKQAVIVTGTFCNREFIISNFSLPGEKVCRVIEQSYVEKSANTKIGVQGLRYRVITEEVVNDLLENHNRSLWREGDAWYVEKEIEDDAI